MNDKDLPLITICIPTKNRAWCIGDVLKAIEELEYPKKKLKLVFVDYYSDDGAFDAIKSGAEDRKADFYKILLIQVLIWYRS